MLFLVINQIVLANDNIQTNSGNVAWYHGVWEGWTIQTNPNSQYTTVLSIVEGDINTIVGTTAYPELRCGGTVKLVSQSASKIVLHETITYGNCIDNGIIDLTLVNNSTSQFHWYSNSHPAIADSTLSQISTDNDLPLQQYVGVWEGNGTQNSGSSWTILITLVEGETNEVVGTIAYPSLRCGGKLTLQSASASELTFLESITYGGNCVDQGIVTLSVNDLPHQMSYTWERGSSNAAGSLEKLSGESFNIYLPLVIR